MGRFRNWSLGAGVLAAICYVVGALLAYARCPLGYSPLSHWLSDLGNTRLNPSGAIWYNGGLVVTGVLLVPFFLGLAVLAHRRNPAQHRLLDRAMMGGFIGILGMALSGAHPSNVPGVLSRSGFLQYLGLGLAFVGTLGALRSTPIALAGWACWASSRC